MHRIALLSLILVFTAASVRAEIPARGPEAPTLDELKLAQRRAHHKEKAGIVFISIGAPLALLGGYLLGAGIVGMNHDSHDTGAFGGIIIGAPAAVAGLTFASIGLITNRVGHARSERIQKLIDERATQVSLDVGVNSLKLSCAF